MSKSKLEAAIQLAKKLHSGQRDKAGDDYIHHPLRVMNALETETEKIVGVLHDTLEDTCITREELEAQFGPVVAAAIETLSRRKGEPYFDFIRRVQSNPLAVKVKIEDLKDNMNLSRLKSPSSEDLERNAKYETALKMLT